MAQEAQRWRHLRRPLVRNVLPVGPLAEADAHGEAVGILHLDE
jgi:hypothetical protein